MPGKKNVEERKAEHGEKMIEIRIRFWTDNIAKSPDLIRPKHAWSSGVVIMDRNKSHGITPKEPTPFNSIMELLSIIEKVLIAHGITLHASRKMQRFFDSDE